MGIQAISGGMGLNYSAMAQSLIKKIDTNNDGSISQSEFQTYQKNANGSSGQDSVQLFSSLDTNNDSSISQSELETYLKKLSAADNSSAGQKSRPAGGGGGGGGGGGMGGAGGTGSASSTSDSSTSLIYDVRDTNHDGYVSVEEELAYEATHLTATIENQNSNNGQYQKAINQYQQNGSNGLQGATQSQLNLSV